jgi:hypothetical protein
LNKKFYVSIFPSRISAWKRRFPAKLRFASLNGGAGFLTGAEDGLSE